MGTKQISRFRIALIGGLIVFVLAVLCGAYLLRPSLRARYLFHELEPLQVGHRRNLRYRVRRGGLRSR